VSNLVTNPLYAALSALHSQLERDAPTMSNALKGADQQMLGGGTWVGPAARDWGSQLDGYSRDCASQVNGMLAELEQQMQLTPQKVTQQEAMGISKEMQLAAESM
jgi:hypothetical protein